MFLKSWLAVKIWSIYWRWRWPPGGGKNNTTSALRVCCVQALLIYRSFSPHSHHWCVYSPNSWWSPACCGSSRSAGVCAARVKSFANRSASGSLLPLLHRAEPVETDTGETPPTPRVSPSKAAGRRNQLTKVQRQHVCSDPPVVTMKVGATCRRFQSYPTFISPSDIRFWIISHPPPLTAMTKYPKPKYTDLFMIQQKSTADLTCSSMII